jgi:hypothetical protein
MSKDNKYIFATSEFKRSIYVKNDVFDFNTYKVNYVNVLNKLSGYDNWFVKGSEKTKIPLPRSTFVFILENDLNLTCTAFFRRIQSLIYNASWSEDTEELTEDIRSFVRGFIETRGSIDTNRPFISQDYFYNSKNEISKAKILFDLLNLPVCITNVNFRELQNDFVTGKSKRNTQFRLNLNWYAKNIGFFNLYKATIFENKYHFFSKSIVNNIVFYETETSQTDKDNSFISYLSYFAKNVYGQTLSKNRIDDLRNKLGFNGNDNNSSNRSKKVVDAFIELAPDVCAICGTTTTFTSAKTGKQHFDIHHMISFKNGKSVDVTDNLVKLCNTCHTMMKKGCGTEQQQLDAIKKILEEQENIYDFCSTYLCIEDIDLLAKKVRELLG